MHELHRAERLIKELRQRGVSGKIDLTLGHIDRTMIMIEEVKECFEILAKDSDLEGSVLKFVSKEVGLKCSNCGRINKPVMECQYCGSLALLMDGEDELEILKITPLAKDSNSQKKE